MDILNGPYYLNDRIIELYFSSLSSCHVSEDILLVPPSIVFWILNGTDVAYPKDFIEPLKLQEKKLVIFQDNDNDDVNLAEGGSHWCLVVYERNVNKFVHHDSSIGTNKMQARQLFSTIVGFIGDSTSASNAEYQECIDSPQQTNVAAEYQVGHESNGEIGSGMNRLYQEIRNPPSPSHSLSLSET